MKRIIKVINYMIINVNNNDETACNLNECMKYKYDRYREEHHCIHFNKDLSMGKYGRIYRCSECLSCEE